MALVEDEEEGVVNPATTKEEEEPAVEVVVPVGIAPEVITGVPVEDVAEAAADVAVLDCTALEEAGTEEPI